MPDSEFSGQAREKNNLPYCSSLSIPAASGWREQILFLTMSCSTTPILCGLKMHNIMDEHILSIVRSCSRDEQSYQTLKQIVNILQGERDHYRKYMDLLERAVRNDYEAIMITEASFEGSDPVIAFVNEGFSRMTGFGREEVAGLTPRILHGKKTDQSVLHQMRQKLMDGESFFGETVTYRRDGTEFVNQWDVHPLKDQGGEITHWVSYQQDVTQQRALEQHYNSRKREWDNLSEDRKSTRLNSSHVA